MKNTLRKAVACKPRQGASPAVIKEYIMQHIMNQVLGGFIGIAVVCAAGFMGALIYYYLSKVLDRWHS